MRALAGRGHWLPQQRIGEITRLAFIGDSYVFGQGVSPDETLPARTERHLNEVRDCAPVEAVNLGVCGYNFWNSWLAFKAVPQIYDGVVLVLCCNDAQLFGRAFTADYAGETTSLWLPDSSLHSALEKGFDDIATFVRERGTRVAVCYFNVMGDRPYGEQRWSARIAEAIANRCSARSIPFVDMHAHFVERSLPADTSIVNDADFHPSAAAHDAASRHLAGRLHEWGWLKDQQADTAEAVASATNRLIADDSYPPDVALRWAEGALDAKLLAARRHEALTGGDGVAAFIAKAREETLQDNFLWHRGARASALLQRAMSTEEGVAAYLSLLDEQMLRLKELSFAAASDDKFLRRISPSTAADAGDIAGALSRWKDQLAALAALLSDERAKLQAVGLAVESSRFSGSADAARFVLDSRDLAEVAARLGAKFVEFGGALELLTPALQSMLRELPDVHARVASEIERAVRGAAIAAERLHLADAHRPWTIVHVEVRTTPAAVEGRHPCALEVQASSTAPSRLPLMLRQNFLPDGEPWRLAFAFPAFYAGRVFLQARVPDALVSSAVAEIGDVEIVHGTARRAIARQALTRDEAGRLVSPPFFVL